MTEREKEYSVRPIGFVRSPYQNRSECPRQGDSTRCKLEILYEYAEGLKDIEAFRYIICLYYLHESTSYSLTVQTPWDTSPHGLFATRSPNRVNPIGFTVAKVISREGNALTVTGIDALDGTPILDLKPYFPGCDSKDDAKSGWMPENSGPSS